MIFSEDDISFSLNVRLLKSEAELNNGLWLILVAINGTPPHIALINEAKYYSLSTRKVDCGNSLEKFISVIERKHIPTLFVHIEIKKNIDLSLEKIYRDLQPLGNSENTCLSPIKELFAGNISPKFASTNYVFELLSMAEKMSLIKECLCVFCQDTNSNSITLPKYTMAQIKTKIQAISSNQLL
jgi:hypothetical protein